MLLLQTPSVRLSSFFSAVCPGFLSSFCVIPYHAELVGFQSSLMILFHCLADRRASPDNEPR